MLERIAADKKYFLNFPRQLALTFQANCLLKRQFVCNVKDYGWENSEEKHSKKFQSILSEKKI